MAVSLAACSGSPAAPENAAPTVTVAFVGGSACTPAPRAPCTLDVIANATDPDGDPLQFIWAGCASGTAPRATCTVHRAGQVVASVEVTDGHGHTVRGAVTGEGTEIPNRPPTVTVAFEGASSCELRPGKTSCAVDVLAHAADPDGDAVRYVWSGCASGTSTEAPCEIDRIGPVVASVEVSDEHGHTVSGSVTAHGVEMPNARPAVTLAFEGPSACTPLPGRPCTLTVVAQASDPDGDPLRYAWSGCTSGTSTRASCTIDRPGPVTALVAVTDDHAHTTDGSITGQGVNQPPGVGIGYFTPSPSGAFYFLGNVMDPDEGSLCGRQYCESLTASGACHKPSLDCTCLGGLEASVYRNAASGVCTVTFTVKDSWGQPGMTTISFDINNPRLAGLSSGSR